MSNLPPHQPRPSDPEASPDTVRFDPPAAEPKAPDVTVAKAEGFKLPDGISPEQARQIREVEAKIRRIQQSVPKWAWKAGLIALPVILAAAVALWFASKVGGKGSSRRRISVHQLVPLAASARPALSFIRHSLRGVSRRHVDAVLGNPDAERDGPDRVRQALYLLVDVMNPKQHDATAVAVEYDERGQVEDVEFLREVPRPQRRLRGPIPDED